MNATPIPHDIPLPFPAPVPVLVTVLIGFFLMHIAFVNFMVGGAMLTLWYEIKGLKEKRFDRLAHDIAGTITANKSIAVVLGVGPLLAINTLYTVYFYSANALTGLAWVSIIPLVTTAFLLTYAHKYLWEKMERYKAVHLALIALTVAIFCFIPLIFLTNINLMLFPDKWGQVQGFVSALMLPNVWPRYFHFLLACPAMTGLLIVWYYRRKPAEKLADTGFSRAELIRIGYRWALWPTVAQFAVGPLALLTLPTTATHAPSVSIIFGFSLLISALLVVAILTELKRDDARVGKGFGAICTLMLVIVLMMGTGRHIYREAAVSKHRLLVEQHTQDYMRRVDAARKASKGSETP